MAAKANHTASATEPPSSEVFIESEQVLTPAELWSSAGFRLGLYGLYGRHMSLDKGSGSRLEANLDATVEGVEVGAGARLDHRWALMGRLQYALISRGLSGVHFNASVAPQISLKRWLSVEVSLGLAGVIEFETTREERQPQLQEGLIAPYDHPPGDPALSQCAGFGPSQGLRLNLHYILGALSELSGGVYVSHQRVTCVLESDRVEPDSALPIERRQSWEHLSWGITGGVTWR